MTPDWRQAIADYIREQARPVDKYSHQPRLYALACRLGTGMNHDDEVLYAACWLHDLGVFIGHRPEDPAQLARWDNQAYALDKVPGLLTGWGFPAAKIPAVLEAIAQHMPASRPEAPAAVLLHDADLLEQLGAVGLLRAIAKVGRDTRYMTFADLLPVLTRAQTLPEQLILPQAQAAAAPRLALLVQFLRPLEDEARGVL